MRLILASASPRRADLLRAAGFEFDVVAPDVDERPHPGESPRAYVERLARAKASAVGRGNSRSFVLAADTTVVLDGRMLAKPLDAGEAREMLEALSGREHEVLTGVGIARAEHYVAGTAVTRVRFARLPADQISWYIASGEPFDKAGAYGIQGRAGRFVESIEGSYSNVVGLPVALACRLLGELGWKEPPRFAFCD